MARSRSGGEDAFEAEHGKFRQEIAELKAALDANRGQLQQPERPTALSSLELRARGALRSIYRERLETPLVPRDADYAEFSSKFVERLQDGARKVDGILEEECRDLFSLAATCVFSHLLHGDPNFDFGKVIGLVPEELRDGLAGAVEGHVDVLLGKFSCSGGEGSDGAEADGGDRDDGVKTTETTPVLLRAPLYHPVID